MRRIEPEMNSAWDSVAPDVQFTLAPDDTIVVSRLPHAGRILDIGCGYGRNAALLRTLGYPDVVGYDSSRLMIERGHREHPTLNLRHHDGLRLPESDGAFSAALCCAVLTSIPDRSERAAILAELRRVLVPGGPLYLIEFLRQSHRTYSELGTLEASNGCVLKHFQRSELLDELKDLEVSLVREAPAPTLSGGRATALHVVGSWPPV